MILIFGFDINLYYNYYMDYVEMSCIENKFGLS